MTDVSKVLPGGRVLLENARLSFLRGAKIGVLGANGSGKSSLLRVIAGDDREHHGEVWRKDGVKFLYLTQEPQLDYDLDVRGAYINQCSGLRGMMRIGGRLADHTHK